MNTRRGFLKSMLLGAAACTILPGAVTYKRTWKQVEVVLYTPTYIVNPEWLSAPFEISMFDNRIEGSRRGVLTIRNSFEGNQYFVDPDKIVASPPIRFAHDGSGVLRRVPFIIEHNHVGSA